MASSSEYGAFWRGCHGRLRPRIFDLQRNCADKRRRGVGSGPLSGHKDAALRIDRNALLARECGERDPVRGTEANGCHHAFKKLAIAWIRSISRSCPSAPAVSSRSLFRRMARLTVVRGYALSASQHQSVEPVLGARVGHEQTLRPRLVVGVCNRNLHLMTVPIEIIDQIWGNRGGQSRACCLGLTTLGVGCASCREQQRNTQA